ncbi:ABC-three component system protein [Acanthopleuribacter pedis]|uniref:ABC-three component systems C-terminal domain-containing protein n=1 Tax=Acanthopleuribacter pedis TaxID=442870 RepID=A0A8J7Q6Q6_9BACT|nr:ABC-three component system protein [Acanthopleuribacter pedis]MBO1321562.1 hypothetical protein [Acanthopleuribacter pedis]
MNDAERAHVDNLILLCDACHSVIDNPDNEADYGVALLQHWKQEHEETYRLGDPHKKLSAMALAVKAISEWDFEERDGLHPLREPFEVDAKIAHNHVVRNRSMIQVYKAYFGQLNAIYQELETHGSFRKQNMLRNIQYLYLKAKGLREAHDAASVLEMGDALLEDVQGALIDRLDASGFDEADRDFAVAVMVVDAFLRCKVLEEPVS